MDRRGRVVDVGDRTSRRNGLQVLVEQAVLTDPLLQFRPVPGGVHGVEKRVWTDIQVLVINEGLDHLSDHRAILPVGPLKPVEGGPEILRHLGRCGEDLKGHCGDVIPPDVHCLRGVIVDPLLNEVSVKVHLSEADGPGLPVTLVDRRRAGEVSFCRHVGQERLSVPDCLPEVFLVGLHHLRDVERAKVASDISSRNLKLSSGVEGGRGLRLQDLRAKVGHRDPTDVRGRVVVVDRVLKHEVRVSRLELQFCDRREQLTSVDLGLADVGVIHHPLVLLRHRDLGERDPVLLLNVVRREQVHVVVVLRQLEGDVRDDDSDRQGLDADLLVGVLALGVEEGQDIRVVRVEVHGTCALTLAELVDVREGVFEQLHERDYSRRLVLVVLDRCAGLPDVAD